MNMITIELCQEDRARLDRIIGALEQTQTMTAVAPIVEQDAPQPEAKEEPIPETEVSTEVQETIEEVVEEGKEEVTPELAEEPALFVTHSDIQKKVVTLSAAGKKEAVREIVTKYANRVSAIPAEHTAEVWTQLAALEA